MRDTHIADRLGAQRRIGVAQTLHVVTVGAACTLKPDHEIGSIECGKCADFGVLEDARQEVDPMARGVAQALASTDPNSATRLPPRLLAWYIARSAFFCNCASSTASSG